MVHLDHTHKHIHSYAHMYSLLHVLNLFTFVRFLFNQLSGGRLDSFEYCADQANTAVRLYGYLVPPETGEYT